MILFIHGFGSCGWGEKSLLLRRHFGIDQVIAPDLPSHPEAAMAHLRSLIERYPVNALIGSSLGGFLATALNTRRPLPTVLINPVVRPHERLSAYLGRHRRWCDDMPFDVGEDYLDILRSLHRERLSDDEPYLVLLQQGDEVLDYRDAAAYYSEKTLLQLPGGNHRFDKLDQHLPLIRQWLNQNSKNHAEETQTPTGS